MDPISLRPIGIVRSPVREPADDIWGGLVSIIELDPEVMQAGATAGLEDYSHVQVLFYMHQVRVEDLHYGKRRPRGRKDVAETGILAQRARARPNRMGVTTCRLLALDGLKLTVESLDAIDGTPVIDVKPYMIEFGPQGQVHQPAWASEVMKNYFNRLP